MKISEEHIKKLIKMSLLKEQSINAYARFVQNMEKLALFSEQSLSMSHYKKTKPKLFQRMKALGARLVKKIQGDFPGTLDLDAINMVIEVAKEEKKKDPSIDYAAKVIELSDNLWFNNINKASSRAKGNFYTADPKSRGVMAKSLDRTLKYAWKQEANQPENKAFWENFEVWHAVGGIVGVGGGGFNHETVFQFLEDFKTSNPHELSAYGHPGKSEKSLNPGISEIIKNSRGWKDKVHIRLDGEITFAANFDITTQWLGLKDKDTKEFEKAADFNKLLTGGGTGSDGYAGMITGPKDELISGQDTYNEIVIKDSKATALVMPDQFFDSLKNIGSYKFENTNMFTIGSEINNGNLSGAMNELLENAGGAFYIGMTGNWYAQDLGILYRAMLDGDTSVLSEQNRAVEGINVFSKYLDIDLPFYNMAGQEVTTRIKTAITNLQACIDFIGNPNVSRKTMSLYDWIKENRPKALKFVDVYLKYINPSKFPGTINFMKSEEGKEFIDDKARELKISVIDFDYGPYEKDFNNPKEYFAQNVPYSMMSKAGNIPLQLHQMINMGRIFSTVENQHPAFTALPSPEKKKTIPPPPPPEKKRISDNIIMPPYFITINWKDTPKGPIKSYTDDVKRVFGFREHQNNASSIKKMLDGIVNKGGSVEYFGIYDPEIMSFVKVSSKEQFDKLLIPSIDSLPPKPDRKKVAEVKIAKKQIIDLIQNIS
jgi:multimeric flavodoxin WrbA